MFDHMNNQQQPVNSLLQPQRPMFDHEAFRALQGDQPAMQAFQQDYRTQRGDWRNQMHDYRNALHGQPMPQTNPGVQGPPVPNMQFPINSAGPANMVGSSYMVQGMTPASSPYGLPTY